MAPGSRWVGGWMGLRAGVEAVAKKKLSAPIPVFLFN